MPWRLPGTFTISLAVPHVMTPLNVRACAAIYLLHRHCYKDPLTRRVFFITTSFLADLCSACHLTGLRSARVFPDGSPLPFSTSSKKTQPNSILN
jgi:hypothetical protein